MDVLTTIREFLEERLTITRDRVVPDASLKALGIDSLMLLELIFECEEKLNIKIDQDTTTPATIGELITIVERMSAGTR